MVKSHPPTHRIPTELCCSILILSMVTSISLPLLRLFIRTFGVGSGAHALVNGVIDLAREVAEQQTGSSSERRDPPTR